MTMNATIRQRTDEHFELWVLHDRVRSDRFSVRFRVRDGVGVLQLNKSEKTPTKREGQIDGLSAEQIKRGRFMWLLTRERILTQEYALWRSDDHPCGLPIGQWIRMISVGDGLVPEGWSEPEGETEQSDCVTDVRVGVGLGAALQLIKARRKRPPKKQPPAQLEPISRSNVPHRPPTLKTPPAQKRSPEPRGRARTLAGMGERGSVGLGGAVAPPGLVRHLRRTIDRQREEIEALRSELARLRQ